MLQSEKAGEEKNTCEGQEESQFHTPTGASSSLHSHPVTLTLILVALGPNSYFMSEKAFHVIADIDKEL